MTHLRHAQGQLHREDVVLGRLAAQYDVKKLDQVNFMIYPQGATTAEGPVGNIVFEDGKLIQLKKLGPATTRVRLELQMVCMAPSPDSSRMDILGASLTSAKVKAQTQKLSPLSSVVAGSTSESI